MTSRIAFSNGNLVSRRKVAQPFSSQVPRPLSPFTCMLRKRMSCALYSVTAAGAGLRVRVTR